MAIPAWWVECQGGPRREQRDLRVAGAPAQALAVLEALRFDRDGSARLRTLDAEGFRRLLAFCDPAQLTLTLDYLCGRVLPGSVRDRIAKNTRDYFCRFDRLKRSLFEIAERFDALGIEFIVLKGVTHAPDFSPDPLLRAQGDIDIWCKPEQVYAARDALSALGYLPLGNREERHLPPMIRDTGWCWRGDYFASDLPISIELHYRLWDEHMEAIPVPGQSGMWNRRTTVQVDGRPLPALALHDRLGFAALHLMMHVLHGDLRLQRAWEIARFLETHTLDEPFWDGWHRDHPEELRRLETIIFELCSGWFGCDLSPTLQSESERLNSDIKRWIEHYGLAPVKALFQPNKDELWLQLCLVKSRRDKLCVIRRRVVPLRPPERVHQATLKHSAATPGQFSRHLRFLGSRAIHHARALAPLVRGGAKWWWLRTGLTGAFLRFQAVSGIYCLGMSVFFLLYNLHLLRQGLRENTLGQISGLMTLGTLAGTLPAAAITRRIGLRNTLLIAILGTSSAATLRLMGATHSWLLSTAAIHGLFLSMWAVSNSPVVSGLSAESNRRTAFSISCFAGIGIGVAGGLIGGRLPQALSRHSSGGADPTQPVLIVAALVTAFAAWPAMRLRFAAAPRQSAKVFPRQRFLWGFLACILLWSFAVGAFNPFYNAYLSQRWQMNIPRIGLVQALSQSLQLIAILASPLVLRRLGDVQGISTLLLVAGGAMAALAGSPNAAAAAVAYIGFMSLQYMSEPGIFHLLMSRVPDGERSGASALYFLAVSIAGSIAAFLGGAAITRFGYSAMLAGCSILAMSAALLFRGLVHEEAAASMKSPTSS